MLTNEQLASLEIGDQLDLPGLFLGLTDEPVMLLVTEVGSSERTVEGRYFGVLLGYWTAFEQGGSVGWRYRKPHDRLELLPPGAAVAPGAAVEQAR